jgi:hypothetical protein
VQRLRIENNVQRLRIVSPPSSTENHKPQAQRERERTTRIEESANTDQNHIHRGQDKSDKWQPTEQQIGLPESLALRCAAF